MKELGREFQERLTVAVKEDVYSEVLWEGIDKIGSCRERKSEGNHYQDFYALKKIHRARPGLNSRTSDPVANMITTVPPGFKTSDEWRH